MISIDEVINDGFRIGSSSRSIDSIAFVSLKAALKSFFSTYKSISLNGSLFFSNSSTEDYDLDRMHTRDYLECYSETIVHFQHFFELIFKDILRKKHELLVLNIDKKHNILFKLLNNEPVDQSELERINTIEFSTAYDRLCKLIENGDLEDKYNFLCSSENKKTLQKLNVMRNRIWHRGNYVMRYSALDLFVGKFILPIVNGIVSLPEYTHLERTWRYNPLSSEIDPINEINQECRLSEPSIDKIAFLKELGRAAYSNPLTHGFKFFNDEIVERSQRIANHELYYPDDADSFVNECPVCGVKSFVKYEDSDGDQNSDGSFESYWVFIYYLKCHCCSFELYHSGLKNPSEYGYAEPDYWDFKVFE